MLAIRSLGTSFLVGPWLSSSPGDVSGVEDRQALVVLQVGDAKVGLEPDDSSVSNVGPVQKGAEEQEGE